MVYREIKIGSQVVINKKDSPEKVRENIRKLAQSGLQLARVYVLWDNVEPEEGVWDFSQYDACFDETEKCGVGVAAQLMAVSPPGWMQLTESSQGVANIEDEVFWARAMDYVDRVVSRYHTSPALNSWMLWNEPHRVAHKNENTLKLYREYLKRVYDNDIEKLNSLYYQKYKDFDEVESQKNEYRYDAFKGYVCQLDWIRFTIENLCNKLQDITDRIKKIDTVHPVHVNPAGFGHVSLNSGQSVWHEAKTVDFMGGSVHPSWHSTRFPVERYNQSVAFFSDILRSATPDKYGRFWVSELQGGTNIYSGETYMCPDYNDIKNWIWEIVGSGATGVVFWCFNVRDGGGEAGEWSLLNQLGQPSKRLIAAGDSVRIIKSNKDLFDNSEPAKPDVWILHSENTWALSLIQGSGSEDVTNPRNKHMAADALVGAYLMCSDLGLNAGFINEEKFVEKGLEKGSVLLLPGCVSLGKKTCEALYEFTRNGGTVIADGLVGMYDYNGFLTEDIKGIVNKIFGCQVKDIEAQNKDFFFTLQDSERVPGWFLKCCLEPLGDSEALGSFACGENAVIKNGNAIRIGTVFFQKYLHDHDSARTEYLKKILPKLNKEIVLNNPSRTLRIRQLKSEKADILIVLNSDDKTNAMLTFARKAVLTDFEQDTVYTVNDGRAEIDLGEREVRIFKVEWK